MRLYGAAVGTLLVTVVVLSAFVLVGASRECRPARILADLPVQYVATYQAATETVFSTLDVQA